VSLIGVNIIILLMSHRLDLESSTQLLIISLICRLPFKSIGVYVKVDSTFFYIDFKSAFDGYNHSKMWACLQRYGVRGTFLEILDAARMCKFADNMFTLY